MPEQMIVTAQPEASEAGARVLMAGGNAVDAAMAAALVQGVVDPQMCGIAGFGSCQIYAPKQGVHTCIDFHGRTPLAATPEMWADLLEGETRDGFGFVLRGNVNDLGYGSVTTPGSLKAYAEAVDEFGTWDWADVVAPAVAQAERGFAVRPHVHYWWTHGADLGRVQVVERLGFSETGRRIYLRPDGSPKKIGERVENPDLARTLALIGREGADVFYKGEIADRIDADFRAHGGLMRMADLEAYRTTRREPLRGSYRGWEIATNHPPGGGIMLVEMLNILENFDLGGLGHNSTGYIRTVCEAMRAATRDKDAHVGDPAFVEIPGFLTDKAYAADIAGQIRAGERIRVPRYGQPEAPHTTHVAVVDKDGTCVTMTHSLGMPSGVITDGLGLHVQRLHGGLRPASGPGGLDRAGQGAVLVDLPDHRLPRRRAAPGDRRAGGHADRHGRAAGHSECPGFRHEHVGRGVGPALFGHIGRDRHHQPHPWLCGRAAAGRGLRGDPLGADLRHRRGAWHPHRWRPADGGRRPGA